MTTQPIDRILAHLSTLPDDVRDTLTSMKRQMGGRRKLSFTVRAIDTDDVSYRLEWARRLKLSRMFDVQMVERDDSFYVAVYPNMAFWIWRNHVDGSEIPNYMESVK